MVVIVGMMYDFEVIYCDFGELICYVVGRVVIDNDNFEIVVGYFGLYEGVEFVDSFFDDCIFVVGGND